MSDPPRPRPAAKPEPSICHLPSIALRRQTANGVCCTRRISNELREPPGKLWPAARVAPSSVDLVAVPFPVPPTLRPSGLPDRDAIRAAALAAKVNTAPSSLSRLDQFLQSVGCSDPDPEVARAAIKRQPDLTEQDRRDLLARLDSEVAEAKRQAP
jgi:hypothetical protein